MADYIFLKKNGKGADIKVSRQDFAKNPNAYRDYTVRMVDKDGSNWDVPFNHINDAVKDGAHVFNMRDNTPQQKTTTPAPQPKSAVAQQAVNFTQKPAQPYQPTWQEQAGMSMAVDQAANIGSSDVQPMVKPGLDTNMLNQSNALANRAMATNLESNQDNLYLDELEKKANELQKQGQAEVNAKESEKPFSQRVFENMNSTTKAGYTSTPYTREVEKNEKIRQANLIQTNVRDARKAIKDAEISQDGSWYQKLGRGLANGVDVRNFDFGITKLRNSMTLLSAANSPNDINNAILDSEALKNKIISENEDKISDWIKAGETTTIMVPYMLQILSTPFKGIGTAASKWVMSKVGQEIAGNLGKRAALLALKGTTRFLGDAVEGAGTAAFFNTAGITADAMRRQRGNAVGQYGSDGYFHYNEMKDGEDSYAKAFAKAFGASAIEYQSELVGEYFSPLLKGIGKVAGKGLQKAGVLGIKEGFDTTGKKFTNIMLNFGGKNVSLDKTIGMITALSNKQYLKAFNDFTKATRWNGVIGEYAEEVVGNIENAALVGDMNWGTGKNGVFNPEQNWETFLSVAVGSGFMGALGGVSYIGSRIAVNRGLKKSDEMGMALFGADAWRSIKDGFETADNPARFLAAISQNLDEPSKRAIQNYAAYSMAKKGELVADMKQRMEEPQPTNVRITPYKGRYVVQSVDLNGNIIESKDYDSEEDANIYKERVATYIDNARKVQAYNDFILRGDIFDYDYDTYALLQKIAYKDPLKRTDAEQEFFDNFINSTENITYPTNEVHEEHDAQKGADLAEETSENIVEGAKPLNDREAAAKTRWNAVVQSQPDIDSLVGTMVNQGMTSNEIAQRLVDDYGGESEVVEAFCELCNAKANKDGYINRIGQLIQSKVENDIDEASFAGTVNGNEDKSNIYLLTNGTNTFALIGGDITVDSNNNISSNGIAIMLDGQGNRITRPDLTDFSLRGIVDKNQYKQSSLLELQQEATAAIQATETVVPEVQQPQATEPQNEVQPQEQPQEQPQTQVEEQPQEPAATTEKESPIPLGENGEMLYHKAPIEATINYLYDGALEDEEIRDFVQNNIDESTKGYDKTTKKKPKIGTDKNAYLQAKQAWQQQVDEAKQKLDYWNSVNDYIQQQTHTTPEEIQKAQDELSGKTAQQEYANSKPEMSVTPVQFAGEFIRESKIQTQSFYNETGFGDAERKKFPKMIANDGKTIDSLAEELVSADDTYHNGSLYHGDTTEAKNAILEALQTASKKSELGKNTSDDFKEYERQREEAREAFYEENFNMSYSDYLAFEEQQMPDIWRRMSNFVAEEYDRIVNESYELRDEQNNVEQINNENNGNNTEGNRQLAGGSEVLPTEGSNQQGGTSTSTNPAAETTNGSEGSNQNEEVSGGAQGVEEKKTLNKEEADYLISLMKLNAEIAEEVELSPENWISLFGEDGTINTPIGQVKMGEGQYFKLAQQGRDGKLGMVKPTLENPVVVIEEERPAKNGVSERNTSYIFVKTFKKADGSRLYYFTSVTVSKDGKEVVISNQEKSENRISKLLQQSKIAWINPEFSLHPNTQIEESVPLNDSNSTTSTDNDTALLGVNSSELSEGKDTTKSPNLQENQQKTDEKVEEPQEEESQLLTEADIDADEIADDDQKALAKDFLNGVDTGIFAQVAYKNIQIRRDEKANKKKIEAAKGSKKVIVTSVPKSEQKENAGKKSEEKQKAESKAPNSDVDAAKANLYDVLKRFRAAGKSDLSVSIVGLNNKQIEMLGELFKAISHVGYTYIKQGIIKADEWISKMKSEVGDAIKDATGWTDTDIDEVFTQRWNTPYLVDGVRKSLSQWAAEEALAAEQKQEEQKQEEENAQPATVPDSSVVGGKRFPFTKQELEGMTKQQMIDAMWHEVFPKVCEMYKVPSDIMDENAYWFSPRMTTGYPKDSLVAACMKYMEHLYDEVQPATEKQMNYIMKLAAEDEKKLFKDITLTKVAASRVISLMQREEDMINDHSSKQEDFAEVYNELEKIARLNGADLSQKDTKKAERKFVDNVATTLTSAIETGEKPYASIVALRKAAREAGMEVGENGETDIKIQELVEDALVRVAKNIMTTAHIAQVANKANNKFAKEIFEKIKLLYNLQPTISMRSSNRIALQQYSTPLPMAFVADMFATGAKAPLFFNVFEPTAGNGMLVFAIPSSQVHVNEIDENRLDNLRGQEFRQVTTQDATQPFAGDRKYNAIITNPPFGSTEAKDYDGYSISGLAPQIALNALDKMKDNGKAVIIIGGKQEFAPNGAIKNDKPFLAYLYNHYNVKGVIDMDGSLYAKQGTTFPTRMILIDGRRTEEERAKSDVYPPTIKNWINPVADFDRLYNTVNDLINSKEKTNGTEIVHAKDESLQSDRSVTLPGNTDKGTDSRKPVQDVATTGRGLGPNRGNGKSPKRDNTQLDLFGGVLGGSGGLSDNPENESGTGGGSGRRTGRDNGPGGKGVDNRLPVDNLVPGVQGTATRGVGLTQEQENRKLDSEKLPYRPHNGAFSLESLAPAAMVEAMDKTLKRIEEEYGNIDEFVTNELGYDSIDAMHKALAAEQVDSVAMAIYNMKKGEALIIGDQTGVGKGRQMAALIRWAHRQGKKPIFMTQKSNLFNDIYRDLKDIGSENLKPFIFNDDSDAKIVEIYENDNGDEKQKIIYRSASKEEINKALKSGKIPDDCDFVLCTYSQISTGDETSKEYETQLSKEEGGSKRRRSRKQNSDAKPKSDKKAILLRKLAKDNYLMLDESHTAAGESNQGFYMQTLVRDSKAVTFASATYAKRPDTMPLYALRTAMSKANIGMKKLIEAIQKGGVTLQEIMSRALTNSGQMVRRERDMEGVVTDWTTIDDPETVKKARENYDKTIKAFNAIIDFQNKYIEPVINNKREDLAVIAGNAGFVKGTEKMGINNTPFASKTYNYTKQLMLALKVDAIVDEVDRQIKAGRKPVIALDNTMGALFDKLTPGDEVNESTFAENLLRGLDSVMQYSQDSGKGREKTSIKISPSELGTEGESAYYELVSFIKESTKDIFISPLDEITAKLRAKGYNVGELTGRKNVVVEDNGTYRIAKRGKISKQLLQSRFNSGKIDVVILNKTGSTGISLHASKTFADQRQRVMILAQPLPDINDYMQMIGRIDRTGQVKRGYYINLGLPVPAEQRFLMMLSTKLKSLNANTTTSQESKDNKVEAPDMLNKYGSQVIVEYFKDHPDIYNKLDDPLNVKNKDGGLSGYKPSYDDEDARKLTGQVALLSTDEQQAFYDDVIERYNNLIKYLDDSGTNDLKITSLPLNATTLARAVSSEGNDPTGDNPFAQNAYVEKVEMDVLRKPMKANEINNVINTIAKGKDPKQAVEDIKAQYETEFKAKLDKQKRKYEAELERNKETLKKYEDKINGSEKMSDEDKRKAIEDKKESLQQDSDRKNDNAISSLEYEHERMIKALDLFKVGGSYLIPDNLDTLAFDLTSHGIFLGYKAKDNGITPSSTIAVFATLDGRRRVEIKLSEGNKIANVNTTTNQNYDAAQQVNLTNWDNNIPNITRKTGYIITGNILQAINDSQDENGNFTGQLVSYTDSEGNIHDGVLMPDKWEPTMMVNAGNPISSAKADIESGKTVISINGEVEIVPVISRYNPTAIYLRVPRSKKLGAKYYENEDLIRAIDEKEFYQNSGKLQTAIPNGKLDEVLSVLSKMGVKVPSDIVKQLTPQQDNRLAYSSSTNNVNNPRIIPEDVDKDVSLQIESEFDSAIENLNLTEEEKDELENLIGEFSNLGTNDLEYTFYLNNSRLRIRNEKENNLSEMLWRRGNSISETASATGSNLRDEKSGTEPPTTTRGEYSAVVSRQSGETERENTSRGNEVQGQHNGPRDIRNTGSDRLLLHEGRRIEEKVVSQTPRTRLSSHQRRLLAAQYAISRELVYRDIRLAAIKESLGLEAGKQTSLDDVAKIFEKYNKNKEVKALFDKILTINKRLGTSVEILESDENGNYGSAGTRRDVRYYLDGFTRTSSNQNVNIPLVIAHELLHQGTVGAINLVRKGKAEGVLTKEQIDAVNTILDIYNKVKANEGILSESKRGLANPYEFAAQMVDPRQRRALSMSPLERVMAAANELKVQGNNSLWERIKNALKTLFGLSDLKKMDNAINTLLDTFNETIHDISMADVEQDDWGYTSTQLFDKYPTWLSGQTTGTGQHTTQITSTVNTYKKIGEWMKSQGMNGASVLDASSGLGKGTEALRDMGFNVEDVEPYPSETRTPPTYLKYEDIKGKYDVVISNAVLNVIPDDWRADVLKNMADKVKPGGKMIINVRDAKEIEKQKQKIELDSPSEILVTDKAGNIRAYQKGFTQKELADWIQSELGEGWTIETAKPSNSGISGRAVVVTRNTETPLRYRKVSDSMQKPKMSEEGKSRMRDVATSLAKSLNTPVKIVTSDEAPEEAKNAKGYYDTRTGEVVIVLDNNQSVLDIEKTVVHEIIGHHGLRGLLGSVRNYRQLMNVIYDSLSEKQKNEIKDKAMRNGYKFYEAMDEYFAEQAENMVWDISSATMWDNIKHYITEAIHKLGFILRPNYRDVRYWLWLSKNNLQPDNPLSEIKRQAFLHKLSRLDAPKFDDNFNETEGDISYTDVDTAFRNGNIQGGTAWQIIEQRLKDNKQYWKESFVDYMNSYRIFQEEMAKGIEGGLMDNMNAYLGENQMSSKIAELQDQFLNNEVKNLQKQIDELETEFGKGEEGVRALEQYLIMKHGLERNRVLFVRDWFNNNIRETVTESELPEEAKLILENKQIDIETRFEDGDITEEQRDKLLKQAPQEAWEEYVNDKFNKFTTLHSRLADDVDRGLISLQDMYTRLDANINSFADFDPNNNDKSGLSAMTEYFVDDNYSDDAIVQQVMSIDEMLGDRKTNLWNAVEAVTQKGLDYDFMSGIVGEEAYNRAKTMFRWYIPLRGMDQKTMEDQYTYIQNSSGIGKKSLVTAKGRTTLAKSPLSTATQMGLSAISRGERNINKQRAYRLVNRWLKENENEMPPATIVDVWYEITGTDINGNPKMEIAIPPITDDMNDEQIRTTVAIFNQRMKDLKRQGLAMNNKIPVEHMRPFDSKNHKSEHIVFVNINGKQKMIVFNGNPRPAQALNGDLNPSNSDNLFKKLMRIMAAAFTSYNPTFLATNLSRDILFSNSNVSIKEGKNYWLKFTKNQSMLLGNFATKYRKLWKDYNNGVQPTTDMGRYFEEFMKNGGKTGFVNQKKIDELQRMLYNNDKKEFAAKSLSMVFEFIENMNDRVENMNRFAAYVTSREMGRSVMRSINDAKEVSVNFNRKGAGSSTAKGENVTPAAKLAGSVGGAFRSSYLFFNAGIQSFYTLARNIENHPFKTSAYAMAVPFIAGSFLVPMLNKIIGLIFGDDGDDEYANIPEWTRRNNICIYLTNGNWAKIPLPIELRAFYGLGDIAAGYSIDERLQSTQNLGIDITSQLSQILPVDFMGEGGNVLAAFVPDVIKPIVQIMTNTDWTGKPIQKATTPFNKYDPEYTKAFKYEFEPFVKLSKNINNLTGGTDVTKGWYDGWWNSPAYWNHLIGGYGGGFVQDIMRTAKTSERLLTRDFDEWSIKEIPILKALFETPTERTQYYRTMNKFQMYRDEAAKSKHDLNKWRKSEDPLLKARFIHDTNKATKPNYVKRMELVDKYLRFENRANKIIDSPRVEEVVKEAKKEELTKAKIGLVNKLDELE